MHITVKRNIEAVQKWLYTHYIIWCIQIILFYDQNANQTLYMLYGFRSTVVDATRDFIESNSLNSLLNLI